VGEGGGSMRAGKSGVEWMSWGWKAEKVWRGGERGIAQGV